MNIVDKSNFKNELIQIRGKNFNEIRIDPGMLEKLMTKTEELILTKEYKNKFLEKGIKIERTDNSNKYLERVIQPLTYWVAEKILDAGILYDIKNKLFGINFYGKRNQILGKFSCTNPGNVYIGEKNFINQDCFFLTDDLILIGSNVSIGPRVSVYTSNHYLTLNKNTKEKIFNLYTLPVCIEDNSWIGGNSVILPGVIISEGTQIAAGSIVTKSTEPYSLYAGNPAKKIKEINY